MSLQEALLAVSREAYRLYELERSLVTLNMKAICSSEASIVRATRRRIPEYNILQFWKIWGLRGGDYEECLLGYKNPVRTSQETHYVSTTEHSRLMLCKIWGFHGGDYEECLLGYKNSVRTSQKTHHVSATESSGLMLCKIWGSHGGEYEECRLLGCYAGWVVLEATIRRNASLN
jgi:hypothetical protein